MPTGYAYPIEEECSFGEFLWRCAMGIDYYDTYATRESDYGEYYRDALREARVELEKVRRVTLEESAREIVKFNEDWSTSYREIMAEYLRRDSLYQGMRDQVESWEPPSPDHEKLKRFMLEQIQLSRPYRPVEPELIRATPEEFIKTQMERAERTIEYYMGCIKRRESAIENAVRWVSQLQQSVPRPQDLIDLPLR